MKWASSLKKGIIQKRPATHDSLAWTIQREKEKNCILKVCPWSWSGLEKEQGPAKGEPDRM